MEVVQACKYLKHTENSVSCSLRDSKKVRPTDQTQTESKNKVMNITEKKKFVLLFSLTTRELGIVHPCLCNFGSANPCNHQQKFCASRPALSGTLEE